MKLTNREYEILELLAKGNSDKQIAEVLKISRRTVQTHMGRIYMKMGVNNRVSAATMFITHFGCSA